MARTHGAKNKQPTDQMGLKAVVLSSIRNNPGSSVDDIVCDVFPHHEPKYAYDTVRVIIHRLRKMGHKISNKSGVLHQGKTGRGTIARYYVEA